MIPGAFITVEGSDGAGKTTQLDFIEGLLQGANLDVVRTREPGGTSLGEQLRSMLLDQSELQISAATELLLVFAARQQHLDELILPAIAAGKWVLSDRFTDATYAYQGAGRELDQARIAELEHWVQGDLQPDITLVLDVDVATGIARSKGRSATADRFEKEAGRFKQAVRDNYLQRARQYPERMRIVDASGSIETVQQQIEGIITEFIKSRLQQ